MRVARPPGEAGARLSGNFTSAQWCDGATGWTSARVRCRRRQARARACRRLRCRRRPSPFLVDLHTDDLDAVGLRDRARRAAVVDRHGERGRGGAGERDDRSDGGKQLAVVGVIRHEPTVPRTGFGAAGSGCKSVNTQVASVVRRLECSTSESSGRCRPSTTIGRSNSEERVSARCSRSSCCTRRDRVRRSHRRPHVGRAPARHRGEDGAGLRVAPPQGAGRRRAGELEGRLRAGDRRRACRRPSLRAARGGRSGGAVRRHTKRAAELLRAGLALWRGPPLADLAFEGFVQDAGARLEEQRLEALELRIEADLRARPSRGGRGRARGARTRAPAARTPARPAHARALPVRPPGRRAGELSRRAAGAHRRAGARAGAGVRELEQAILEQDPALDPPHARAVGSGRAQRVAAASRLSPRVSCSLPWRPSSPWR